jgi:hydrogenase/urease accessory protein HupE
MKLPTFLITIIIVLASSATAHWSDLSVAEISSQDSIVQMVLTYPTGLTGFADTDKSGSLSSSEVQTNQSKLEQVLSEKIGITVGNESGLLSIENATGQTTNKQTSSLTHSTLRLTYRFTALVTQYKLKYNFFIPNVSTASCVATIKHNDEVQSMVFTPNNLEASIGNQAHTAPVHLIGFIQLGIEHILTGYDHLLFLLALIALGGALPYLFKVITAFTVAHSITIALTTFGILKLPVQIIESGIALSIVLVALENIWRRFNAPKLERGRWLVVFAFGLLHGMGFAGILQELQVPSSNLPQAILGFNIGVELGQLAVVIPAFLLLTWFKKIRWNIPVQYAASAVAILAGGYWFIERAFLGG